MGRVGEVQWESVFGTTFPGYYAMFATRHMHEFGTTREQLLAGGGQEPPLRRDEPQRAVPQGDHAGEGAGLRSGGLAVLRLRLLRQRRRRRLPDPGRRGERARELGDRVGLARRRRAAPRPACRCCAGPTWSGCPRRGRRPRQAYEMAGVTAADVKVAEVHDCFTIAEIMAYEDLGFCEKGEGGPFIEDRRSLHRRRRGGQRGRRPQGQGPPHRRHRRLDGLRDRHASCAASAASARCPTPTWA